MIQLPLHVPSARPVLAHLLAGDAARRPRILLVEDDVEMATMYRIQLELDGFSVALAGDVGSGLGVLRSQPVDLVLLDLRLPGLTGFEMLQALKADAALAAIPVVVLSNYGAPEMITQAMAMGAADYLIKSATSPVELSTRLRTLLSRD